MAKKVKPVKPVYSVRLFGRQRWLPVNPLTRLIARRQEKRMQKHVTRRR